MASPDLYTVDRIRETQGVWEYTLKKPLALSPGLSPLGKLPVPQGNLASSVRLWLNLMVPSLLCLPLPKTIAAGDGSWILGAAFRQPRLERPPGQGSPRLEAAPSLSGKNGL